VSFGLPPQIGVCGNILIAVICFVVEDAIYRKLPVSF
jgi:hypothetical protein